MIVWNKPISSSIDHYNIYREVSSTSYNWLGSVPYNSTSVFVDTTSNPVQQAYSYKISAVNNNSIEGSLSSYHTTIHLNINQGIGSSINLIWSAYEGFTYTSYKIYRGTNSSNLTLLTSLSSSFTSYTDLNPPAGTAYYQIEVETPNECSSSKTYYLNTKSNIVNNSQAGINSFSENTALSVYPNPGTGVYTIECSGIKTGKGSINIFDNIGKLVLAREIDFDTNTFKTSFDISEFNNGIYSVRIENGKQSIVKRIIKK